MRRTLPTPTTSNVSTPVGTAIERALTGEVLTAADGYALIGAEGADRDALLRAAVSLNLRARPHRRVTYSRKVFIPLTNLCRDRCGYCTFVKGPHQPGAYTMTPDDVLAVARKGAELGCKEALFSLGDHPEWRHDEMAETLAQLGYSSTPAYVAAMCKLVLEETGLLPHTNCGVLDHGEMAEMAPYNASMGIMLESVSPALFEPGGAHYGTTSKSPESRIATLETAGALGIAMTTGLLLGIGESPEDRIDSLLAIRQVQARWGNVQEIIIQNFRAKPTTRMRAAAEPGTSDMLRTQAAARLLLGPKMNIESPPNLNRGECAQYLGAGINDWGGISPLTKDFINPEAAWPEVEELRAQTADAGYTLRERLGLYPEYVRDGRWFTSGAVARRVRELTEDDGYVHPGLERW